MKYFNNFKFWWAVRCTAPRLGPAAMTTGERRDGHHYKTCNGKALNPRKPGVRRVPSTRPPQTPFQTRQRFSSEGCATSPLPDPRDHHARPGKNPGPSVGISAGEEKTQCRSLFLRTKGLCALLLELPPRRLIATCKKVGSAPYSAPPSPPG